MSEPNPREAVSGPVVFFDADCGLCQRIVRLLLRLDHREVLRFAALQGRSAQEYLRRHGLPAAEFDTLMLIPEWRERDQANHLVRTAAAIGALRRLPQPWMRGLARVLGWIPAPVRDAAYRVVARWRYRIFGPWQPRAGDELQGSRRFLP